MSTHERRIKFHASELIEDSTKSENIPFNRIMATCAVCKARENEILSLSTHPKKPIAYVCRYKLVRETCGYRLEPIRWLPDEEDRRCADEFSDFDEQNAVYTDTDTQSETVVDLNATLEQIHRRMVLTNSTENDDSDSEQAPPQLVSPIRIINNRVYKSNKSQTKSESENKRSSPDASLENHDVSPSKRNKLTDELTSYKSFESPQTRTRSQYSSPAIDQMKKVKKNLSRSSFAADEHMEVDNTQSTSINMDESQNSLYFVSEANKEEPTKMTLRKQTPLKERNENTVIGAQLTKTAGTPVSVAKRSIMKTERGK